jgi:predicted enzyme related to lactoylglutathione lyase
MATNTQNRVVWAEIPVADMDRAMAFYATVLGAPLTMNHEGPFPVAMLPTDNEDGISGNLMPGKPSTNGEGPVVHLNATCDLETAKARVVEAGGKVVSDIIQIPVGAFFYAIDTEGNPLGLFRY